MFEDLSVPLDQLRVSLPTGTLGVFEPVSCMMFLNLLDDDFNAWQTQGQPGDPVGLTFAHETYHYLQTIGTGYLYEQYQRQLHALRKARTSPMWHDLRSYVRRKMQPPLDRIRYFRMPRQERDLLIASNQFWASVVDQLETEKLAAKYGKTTLTGLMYPGLADDLEQLRASALVRGEFGLSAQDVYEGSAVVYALANEHENVGADYMIRHRDLSADSPYDRLAKRALDRCGNRPVSQPLLAASALALRFERPGDAFFPILDRLLGEPPGVEADAARGLSLESITDAGAVLGTAADARSAGKPPRKSGQGKIVGKVSGKRYGYGDVEWYTIAMDRLTSGEWPLDEVALLTDPTAMGKIPGGQLSFGIVTRESTRTSPGATHVNFRRMVGCLMLGSGRTIASVRRELADFFYENRAQLLP